MLFLYIKLSDVDRNVLMFLQHLKIIVIKSLLYFLVVMNSLL